MSTKAGLNSTRIGTDVLISEIDAWLALRQPYFWGSSPEQVKADLTSTSGDDGCMTLGEAKAIMRRARTTKLPATANKGMQAIEDAWTKRARGFLAMTSSDSANLKAPTTP